VANSVYGLAGDPNAGTMLELDAIAAVVIGGTLLQGGQGSVFGTLFGVCLLGIIQTIITFDGTLSSWWTKIVVGGLMFAFLLIQRIVELVIQWNLNRRSNIA
jgi:simple sugar transport system permease protein